MTANEKDMSNFVDTFINYFIKGNVPKRYGGDGFAKNIFTSVSVDWEFPGWSGPEKIFTDPNDGIRLGMLLDKLKSAG